MQNINNIVPANRIANVSEYYFSRKLKEVAKMRAEGVDVISLGIGGPDLPPHQSVVETLVDESRRSDSHSYQPYVGLPELRKAYADWYSRFFNVSINPADEILPLIGSKEGILHTTLAFVNPGDSVLVPNPGYPTYSSVSKLAEANIITYDLLESNGWYPDFEQLESRSLNNVKIMWVNYPNMPTGAPANIELFQKLIDFGKRHNILIINDNPYSFILHKEQLSILSLPGAKDIALEMNSLSKANNMAGWRMGMIAGNAKYIEWILRVKSNIDSGQFRPMMKGAVQAMSLPDSWYSSLNDEYRKRRMVAEKIMAALGCKFDTNQAGLFLWGKIPDNIPDVEQFVDNILYSKHVFITPGSIFGSNGNRYIRISLCSPVESMNKALDRIINK